MSEWKRSKDWLIPFNGGEIYIRYSRITAILKLNEKHNPNASTEIQVSDGESIWVKDSIESVLRTIEELGGEL